MTVTEFRGWSRARINGVRDATESYYYRLMFDGESAANYSEFNYILQWLDDGLACIRRELQDTKQPQFRGWNLEKVDSSLSIIADCHKNDLNETAQEQRVFIWCLMDVLDSLEGELNDRQAVSNRSIYPDFPILDTHNEKGNE